MSVQLSGAIPRDFTFSSAGTRADLLTQWQTQIVAAGWTAVTSTIYQSATTPQGIKIRIEAIDPGSGNCIQFKIRNDSTLVGPTTFFLLPVGGATFRLWANPYQFFYFLSGTNVNAQRALVCGGVPWVPSFIQDSLPVPYAGWLHGNGTTDTSITTLGSTFRRSLIAQSVANYSAIWNGVAFGGAGTGFFGLVCQMASTSGSSIDDMWEDGTFTLFEPVLVWQSANFPNPVRHGLIWDAVLGTRPLDSEVRRVFGDKTWRNITHQNGPTGLGRGSLFLLSPDS